MKKLSMVALSVASLAGMLAVPSQVHAGADGLVDGTNKGDILGIAGSDTTYFVMNALSDAHNLSSRYNPDGDKAINIPPLVSANANVEAGESTKTTTSWLKAARLAWPGGAVLPADSDCTTQYVFGGAGSVDGNQSSSPTVPPDGDVADATDTPFTPANSVPGGLSGGTIDVRLGVQPPNGSGDGRSAISGSAIKGVTYNNSGNNFSCLDIARSSSYVSSTSLSDIGTKFEAWAFALDAIGWTYFPGNSQPAVSNGLTKAQLTNIYQCAPTQTPTTANDASGAANYDANDDGDLYDYGDLKAGYPKIQYWTQLDPTSDVDGTEPAKIVAYRIQPGSGTGKDVAAIFDRSDGTDNPFLTDCDGYNSIDKDGNGSTSFTFPIVQEHDCRNVATADKTRAICWYGYSRWVLQARSLETDKRNGAVFGKYGTSDSNMKRPSFSTINETATRYAGTRLIYNFIPLNSSVDVASSADARRFVGVSLQPAGCSDGIEGGTDDCNFDGDKTDTVAEGTMTVGAVPGFICGDATARRIIASYGFKPIASGLTATGDSSYGTSNCRRNKSGL